MLKLYNTLSRKKESFKPIRKKEVRLYTCGPTVYDTVHIGNLRTYVFQDILRRTLEYLGYKVNQVMNITDVEDKIIAKAKKQKKRNLADITKPYTKHFMSDLRKLGVKEAEEYPKATGEIESMIELIATLEKKGYTYQSKDGSVYFDISKFKKYGKLVGLSKVDIKDGARVDSDEYGKDEARDFVLWKARKDKSEPSWKSPWGQGRPGWHIECSAMAMKYLGPNIDIHTGGVDLIFPHHENEIAQSEAATGKKFVSYWLHGEHLLVDEKRMGKSEKNFFTLKDVEKKGISPIAFRYLTFTANYKTQLNFTWNTLASAQTALWNLWRELARLRFLDQHDKFKTNKSAYKEHLKRFKEAIADDLNMPEAMAALRRAMSDPELSPADRRKIAFEMDKVFGLRLDHADKLYPAPIHIKTLVKGRELLRRNQQFVKGDALRRQVESLGYEIEDTSYGPFIWPAHSQKFHPKT